MATTPPLICLITPGHVSSTPRLAKSADALAEAGYRVRVVTGSPFPPADALDAGVLATAHWDHTPIEGRGGPGRWVRKILRRAARMRIAAGQTPGAGIAARALFAESGRLASSAARFPAQLFIGHGIAGLSAAAFAADARGCAYGFDIEDFHDEETEEAMADPVERRARHAVQSNLLPGCRTLTCSAPLICRLYTAIYDVRPSVILNVFPLSQACSGPVQGATFSEDRPVIFYWFSQTVGPGRGLEKAIAILAAMKTPAELHLRGFVAPHYSGRLRAVAQSAGLRKPLKFLEPGPPNEMARLAGAADIGLSIEESQPLNRDICLTNKIFIYLLAGIPQLLSDTSAQRALAPDLGDAALPCSLARAQETAAMLDQFFADPRRPAAARDAAMELSRRRFCWDVEKHVLLDAVRSVVPIGA
jgi:hypothetical protein